VFEKLHADYQRFLEIEAALLDPSVSSDPARVASMAKERGTLAKAALPYGRYLDLGRQIAEAEALVKAESDSEMKQYAEAELEALRAKETEVGEALRDLIYDRQAGSDRAGLIIEVRAGTGGDEAALFARDLVEMYRRYAETMRWQFEPLEFVPTELGGFREASFGITGDGAFAEYMIASATESSKIPDAVTFETAAPLACAGRTVFRAVAQTRLKPGQWLGLVGSGGGLGHLGIQFARALGLKVVAVDARDVGIDISKELGADIVLDARRGKDAVVKQAKEATGGPGVDATVNVSDADSAAGLAAAITRMHGHVIQIAQPDEVKVSFREFIFRDIVFEGSMVCGKKQSDEMLEVVAKHGVTVTTHAVRGVDKVPEIVELSLSGKLKGKGVVIIDEEAVKKARVNGAKY